MKLLGYISCAATIMAGLMACGTHELVTETIDKSRSTAYEEGSRDSLLMEILLEWPIEGLPPVSLQNIQKDLSAAIFGKEYATTDITTAISEYFNREDEEYRRNVESFLAISGSGKDASGIFSWSEMSEGRFLEPYNNLQSYRLYTYGYTGGAHGMDSEKGFTFNLSDGKRITEADLFKREYKPELSRVLTEHLKQAVDKETYDMLFIKTLEPNGNFYLDPEGITYIYGRYEIGPYVSGIVRVTIPWEELKGLLR